MAISFIENLFKAYSIPNIIGIIISIILFLILVVKCKKDKEERWLYSLLIIPVFLNFLVICKLSPYRSLRYIMNILPIIAIIVICLLDSLFKNKKVSTIFLTVVVCIISVFGLTTNKVKYLYIGYNDYLDIAEENSESRFVLICPTSFVHIYDLPEMKIYKESIIINPECLDELKENEELQQDDEFILSIKNWIGDPEKVLNEVLENTGYTNYELLLSTKNSANCSVYKITKID